MVTLREFSAWITCDGATLMEYETRPDHYNRSATCWVPSEAGKVFTVHWRDHGSQISSAAYISLDGTQVPGRYIWGNGTAFRNSVRSGPTSERPFLFSKYEDNGNKGVPPKREDEVGTIILRIKQIQRGESRLANKFQVLPGQLPSEFAFTTGGVCATFGREVQGYEQWPTTWTTAAWDESSTHSYVKFIFRYRPMQFLIAQGIAPRVSPVRIVNKPAAVDASRPDAIPKAVMSSSAASTPSKGKHKANDAGIDNDTPSKAGVTETAPGQHQNNSQSQSQMSGMNSDLGMMRGIALPYGHTTGPSSYYREHTAPTRIQYPPQQQQQLQRNVSGSSVVSTNSATSTMSGSSATTDVSADSNSTTRVSNQESTSLYPVDDNQAQMPQDEFHASLSLDASSASLFEDFMDLDHFDARYLSHGPNFSHV